ncbi:hypothetical protein P7D22_14690 [Lichenihabitans sp. Uapishka_5]|uniref:hypothetical protein n=1 Tax=Lichenihabitans sp. Uapishka_5 TaxID=3037302 RepID=UPI0029E815D5|nr:hypothetical protein [Lichenihabitans sp. Uapishka_5]MDX7952416.1 hypothetical protein [Lichenihabitans sp. Uapishka_5]
MPGAENISAVLFSNAGTLAKFDRMGIAAGFYAEGFTHVRRGFRFDPDPEAVHPIPFTQTVAGPDYVEHWSDELQVFHNPRARLPLDEVVFSGVTQHFFRDGDHLSIIPEGVVLSSHTMILGVRRDPKGAHAAPL